MDTAVAVAVMAAIATAAEHRAGPSRHRAYRAPDHRPNRSANRSPRGDASKGADRLHWRGARAEREARQRHQDNPVHDRILPISMQGNPTGSPFVPQFAASGNGSEDIE